MSPASAATRLTRCWNTHPPITDQLLAQAARLQIVRAATGIGTDNVDVAAAARRGVVVTNVPDYSVEEVALHALCLMLALTRRLPEASLVVAGGGWGLDGLRPIRRLSTQRAAPCRVRPDRPLPGGLPHRARLRGGGARSFPPAGAGPAAAAGAARPAEQV